MFQVLGGIWALLIGIVLIMLGNGLHFTLIGLRGGIEGFSSAELAIVTSGYFMGFLSGARFTPWLIRRVGHVRVFAALGSFMSAGLITFPLLTEPWAWTLLRVLVGFCMSGIYVTAESWLNESATNKTRLFIVASILVSISFAPILLSVTTEPTTEVARPMHLRDLFKGSPLGTVGIFLLGAVYATQSGMGAVFGSKIGLTASQIALFIAMLFAGALLLQYPIGWLSDRMDRRKLIFGAASLGAASCLAGWLTGGGLWLLMAAAFFAGGVTTPLYALFLAYTNDYLSSEDMPAASGGLVLTFGVGAILGPLVAGWAMQQFNPYAFWLVLGAIFAAIALYALYRMTQRATVPVAQTESYLGVIPSASPVAVESATTWATDQTEPQAEDQAGEKPGEEKN